MKEMIVQRSIFRGSCFCFVLSCLLLWFKSVHVITWPTIVSVNPNSECIPVAQFEIRRGINCMVSLGLWDSSVSTRTNGNHSCKFSPRSQREQIRLIKANRSLCTDLPPNTVVIMSLIGNMIDNQNEWLAQTKLSRRPIVFTPHKPHDITWSKIESSSRSSGSNYLASEILCGEIVRSL